MRGKILNTWPMLLMMPFLAPMGALTPQALPDVHTHAYIHQQEPSQPISELSVPKKLSVLNMNKSIRTWWNILLGTKRKPGLIEFFLFGASPPNLVEESRHYTPSRRPHLLVMLTNTSGPFLWPQFFLKLGKSLSLTATSSLPSLQKLTRTNVGLSQNTALCMP